MAIDQRFYSIVKSISSDDVPDLADVSLVHKNQVMITHACEVHEAQDGAIIYIGDAAYLDKLKVTDNIVIITTAALAHSCPKTACVFATPSPRIAFSQILAHLYHQPTSPSHSPTALVAPDAVIGEGCVIGDYAIISSGAVIGDHCVIGAHSVIEAHCVIGEQSKIGTHVSISYAHIGAHCVIHSHCVIGKSGFGFEMTDKGAMMVPHLGLVHIGDHVQIGAHSVIDKGVLGQTSLADHVMIDNHVHIAHNVQIDEKAIILAQVGIAGSAKIGKRVIIAGQAGVKDHTSIADGTIILSAAKVTKDITQAGTYGGYPAVPVKQHWKEQAALRRLAAAKKS